MQLYLLPPSEGKKRAGEEQKTKNQMKRTFLFDLPLDIAKNASPKDLKCKEKRYEEAMQFNKSIEDKKINPKIPAIERYTGVMFKAFDYLSLSEEEQQKANENIVIVSGLYGLLRPQDPIANYKLPISTKGLYTYREEQKISEQLIDYCREKEIKEVVDLLPLAHKKLFKRELFTENNIDIVTKDFYHIKDGEKKKMTHGVKKVKGEWLREQMKSQILSSL